MRNEVQSTPFGPVPAHWQIGRVGDVGRVQIGRARSPATDNGPNMVPYLRVANVLDGFIDYSDVYRMHFSRADQQRYTLRANDILLNEGQSTELVGRSAIYEGPENRYCIQNSLLSFRAGPTVHPRFARAVFKRWLDTGHFAKILKQTTSMAHLGGERFANLAFPVPPFAEQRRIAEILDSVDEAIRKTDEILAKLRQVKQGLLHDLLTRGIDDNGELRDPTRHPEQFKASERGRIPAEWDVVPLGLVVPRAEYGISTALDSGPGIPVLRMMNIKDGEAELSDLKFSRGDGARALRLRPGDVLFNRTNSMEHVGRTGIWRGQIENASFASYLVRLEPDPVRLRGEFLNRWLNWHQTQVRVRRYATPGVHQVNINPTNLRKTTIALPRSIAEQDRADTILSAVDARVATELAELSKLRVLKQGLMEDLLTGRVRVTNVSESRP